jgi:hypothetical protein
MTVFTISGSLPAPWEDFFCREGNYPHFTLMTRENADACGEENGDGTDGWIDLILDVAVIDEDIARLAIAESLGISNPEEIEIVQQAWCQSS